MTKSYKSPSIDASLARDSCVPILSKGKTDYECEATKVAAPKKQHNCAQKSKMSTSADMRSTAHRLRK